ncbi:phage replication-related protein YjqB (UPF0714/DUF867 family) [Rhizobium sp. PP-WC-1G-195]|nr:phage replication-related protein YjqB (UPF0714/DUF867 family) [Rhizobium sp. PP-WC-1G-195]
MDKYRNFAQLREEEEPGAFALELYDRGTAVVIIAPHGGKIEPGTSEMARAVAGTTYSVYVFEGLKANDNRHLHITSTNFDEPHGDMLVKSSQFAIAFHGCVGADEVIYVGGLHEGLINLLRENLLERGFMVARHAKADLQGTSAANICNRGGSGRGVQFEITRSLRDRLLDKKLGSERPSLGDLVDAVTNAINLHENHTSLA